MQLAIIFFLIQFIMYSNLYNIVIGNPMFGPNVRNARPGEFPFIVALRRLSRRPNLSHDHICTGSLITRQDVLTAAHCIQGELVHQIKVIIGSHHLRDGTLYEVYWWITFNRWSHLLSTPCQFRVNDIANIRLALLVPDNIDLGILSHLSPSEYYNKSVVTAGWGQNENDVVSHRMRTVELTVLNPRECEDRVKILSNETGVRIHNRHICSIGDPFAIMYYGDSGGPVLYQNMIVAIHKATIPFPNDPKNRRKINSSTVVSWYRNFIDFVINPNFNYFDYDISLLLVE